MTINNEHHSNPIAYFITWTTYGSWLPGDIRGWSKQNSGPQKPQPLLEDWCRDRMKAGAIILDEQQRTSVEKICQQHCEIRQWTLHAINSRSNHIHVVVTANNHRPQTVRDQLKANATRKLRELNPELANRKIWTRGGDCQIIDTDQSLESVCIYVNESQDRKLRDLI